MLAGPEKEGKPFFPCSLSFVFSRLVRRLKDKVDNVRFLVQDMEGIGEPVPMG